MWNLEFGIWNLLFLLAAPYALGAAAKPAGDPLAEASAAAYKRQYLEAVSKALSVAGSAEEKAERRGKAFALAAQCYLDLGCPRLAIATYRQTLAALGPTNPEALAAWGRIAEVLAGRGDYHEAITHLEKATAELDLAKLPPEVRVKLLSDLAACREQVGQVNGALAAYESLFAAAQKGDAIGPAVAKAARLYAELHRFDKAIGCLDRLYGKLESDTVVTEAAKAYQDLAQKLPSVGRTAEADALDRKIITLFSRKEPSAARGALLRLLGGEDDAATLKLAATLQEGELRLLAQDDALAILLPAALRLGRAGELAALLTRAMLAEPLDETTCLACSAAIVELRLREGRSDDALAAACGAYAANGFASYVTPTSFARAVDLVTDALRARDGHLVSGNNFRLLQAYGPAGPDRKLGTPDDVANPLVTLAPKPDPARDKLFEATIAARPRTVPGHRARGWFYLLWGKPKNALAEFKRAFALCSLETTELTRAAQDIALGLKALRATPIGMEAFADFQRYGPNGPDGKPKTADDLKDPLEGL